MKIEAKIRPASLWQSTSGFPLNSVWNLFNSDGRKSCTFTVIGPYYEQNRTLPIKCNETKKKSSLELANDPFLQPHLETLTTEKATLISLEKGSFFLVKFNGEKKHSLYMLLEINREIFKYNYMIALRCDGSLEARRVIYDTHVIEIDPDYLALEDAFKK